jgi:hypothetical protein
MADAEDPYLYAGFPISEWQDTEKGRWAMANATEQLVFHVIPDPNTLGCRVVITGKLNPAAETYYTLKYT